jgi:inner membrane protein
MDNLTHALAGLLIAECALQVRSRRVPVQGAVGEPAPRSLRTTVAISSLVAANLPDFDLLYTGAGADSLAYMLHHRGHTHTVLVALVGAAMLWVISLAFLRWRATSPLTGSDTRWLLATLTISTLSHLILDWTNSYGVHPFWPLDSRWFYGDAVFIVEPWFWVVTIPTLVSAYRSRVARVLLSVALIAGLALAWWVPLVSAGAAAALTAGAALMVLSIRAMKPSARALTSLGAWVTVTLGMATGSRVARANATHAVQQSAPGAELLDIVVTPLPANPLCNTIITVERTGDRYVVQMARVSAVPGLVKPNACPVASTGGPTFTASTRRSTRSVHWDRQWSASISELALLRASSCATDAALRFLRVPVWEMRGTSVVRLGDARFGGTAPGILSLSVPRVQSECVVPVPPWPPPRSDVLRKPSGKAERKR